MIKLQLDIPKGEPVVFTRMSNGDIKISQELKDIWIPRYKADSFFDVIKDFKRWYK